MDKKLAFVLSGGGSRGALQVGAMVALLENGHQPDLLVGTSIGSVNAAFLALNGFSKPSLDMLADIWREVSKIDLLPMNYLWLAWRAMFRRSSSDPASRIKDFILTHGISPDLCFADLPYPQLILVSSDLNTGQPVLHGLSPDEKVLDALLVSTTLPPWTMPVRKQGRYEMDGGVVSNLPVEPALRVGATAIIALDLSDLRDLPGITGGGVASFLNLLTSAVERRQSVLELQLAEARGIPTLHIELLAKNAIPLWDFTHTEELLSDGYEIASQCLAGDLDF